MIGLTPADVDYLVSPSEMQNLLFQNVTASTTFQPAEDVDSIRQNAPVWFRTNGRLITVPDFEQYMFNFHGADLYDVKCMNNWSYLSTFYQWLYRYDRLSVDIRNAGYVYVDSCDFNNVYRWIVTGKLEN